MKWDIVMLNRIGRVTLGITPEFRKQIGRIRAEIGASSESIKTRIVCVRKAVKQRISGETSSREARKSTGAN